MDWLMRLLAMLAGMHRARLGPAQGLQLISRTIFESTFYKPLAQSQQCVGRVIWQAEAG